MANKFQKSVLERLEQDVTRQKQAAPPKENQKLKENIPTDPKKEATIIKGPISKSVAAESTQTFFTQVFQPTDIGDYLRRDTQRIAKNKTFYLDADVIEAVKSTAKAQGVTDSKLVNDILRRVLGL